MILHKKDFSSIYILPTKEYISEKKFKEFINSEMLAYGYHDYSNRLKSVKGKCLVLFKFDDCLAGYGIMIDNVSCDEDKFLRKYIFNKETVTVLNNYFDITIVKKVCNLKDFGRKYTKIDMKYADKIMNLLNCLNKCNLYNDENINVYYEGKKLLIFGSKYERDSKVRKAAKDLNRKKHNGKLICDICNFNFEQAYGKYGNNIIDVHHIKPLSHDAAEHKINPAKDVICICPNCHRVIHRSKEKVLSINEMKKIYKNIIK